MALKLRGSKFRHVYGLTYKREQTFENIRITRNTHDSSFCSVNPRFLAVVTESSGGGSFAVLDINRPGRVDVNCPRVSGHAGAVLDIKWSPFNDRLIASGSEDTTVKIWSLPEHGTFGMLTDWAADHHGHSRRVSYIDWHPTADNVLVSVGFDFKIMVWNVEQAEPITSLLSHRDTIYSTAWAPDGSLIATTSKDKIVRVLDPRTTQVAMESNGHESTKASKVIFATDNHLFTTGFSRNSNRQYALWDVRMSSSPLVLTDLDCTSGILLPYYDPDNRVVYLAGKGDGSIRYFEIVPESSSVQYLNVFQTSLPQRGLGMMPKRGIDPYKNEVARFYKLHASKNLVEPISMIVPRKAEGFQVDIFPPTSSKIPSLSADEWTSGVNRSPILIDLQSGEIVDKPRSSMSPAVQPQLAALGHAPHITTYKALGKSQPSPAILHTGGPLGSRSTPRYPSAPNVGTNSGDSNSHQHSQQQRQQQHQHPHHQQQQQLGTSHPISLSPPTTTPHIPGRNPQDQPSQSVVQPQSFTAKAFNSAQAVFNQSVPLSQSVGGGAASPTSLRTAPGPAFQGSVVPPTSVWTAPGSALQGRIAPPTSLRTAPGPAPFSSSLPPGQQDWANGRSEEGRTAAHLGSIRNIRRLSGAPDHEDTASDSPLSTTSSVSLTNLANQFQGRQVSRSVMTPPPPPSPSSSTTNRYSNGYGTAAGMSHATSDRAIHVRKVWSPSAVPHGNSLSLGSAGQIPSAVSSPTSDPELKKAYFRQLEEISALQDQLQLKERRIAQLEAELSRISSDRELDRHAGESNC